jgi:hypothetical protein
MPIRAGCCCIRAQRKTCCGTPRESASPSLENRTLPLSADAARALIETTDVPAFVPPFVPPFDGFQMYARYAMAYWCLPHQIVDAFYCTELPG